MYGQRFYLIGFTIHCIYVILLNFYVAYSYVNEVADEYRYKMLVGMLCCVIYPTCHELAQLYMTGADYFDDAWNLGDFFYIALSITNCLVQFFHGSLHISSRCLMLLVIFMLTLKTFFYMRMFPQLTPIVVMLSRVIYDLKEFTLVFMIQIIMLSQLFSILQLGVGLEGQDSGKSGKRKKMIEAMLNNEVGQEYKFTGLWIGQMLWTLRASIGDFSVIDASPFIENSWENHIFWACFFFVVFSSCVVLLNFIVAEASQSYAAVSENIDQIIWQGKSEMIAEAEMMTHDQFQTCDNLPKYMIVREVEE